jgi:hypothetical protein
MATEPTPEGTHRARVVAFIKAHPLQPLCAGCIATAVKVRASAVQRVATMLEGLSEYMRRHMKCALCGKLRLTVATRKE